MLLYIIALIRLLIIKCHVISLNSVSFDNEPVLIVCVQFCEMESVCTELNSEIQTQKQNYTFVSMNIFNIKCVESDLICTFVFEKYYPLQQHRNKTCHG